MTIKIATTIIMETLEETCFKMLKANKDEYMNNKEETVSKYMRKALDLRNKAYIYLEENKDELVRTIEFSLKGGK